MRKIWLASTMLAFRPVYAFASFPPALPGKYPVSILAPIIAAAQAASAPYLTEDDLSARDSDSQRMLEYWDLTDDLIEGYRMIKKGGTKYLPMFADEEQADYDARLEQTEMTNVYADIIDTLSSKPFEEEISLVKPKDQDGKEQNLPKEISEFIENVDGSGNSLTMFGANVFFNGINSAIHWIYVDYPKVQPGQFQNLAQQKEAGVRPFWSHVLGRNVLSVKSAVINGKETIIYMRILEPGKPNHIRIFERQENGTVFWALFEEKIEQDGRTKKFILIEEGEITIGVIPLVPFITGRRDGRNWYFTPAMRSAADCQVQLYQQESGLKFAKVMTAYPMLAANGISPDKGPDGKPKKLRVGPNRVLYAEANGKGDIGNWDYVSPDAQCLKFLKDDIKETMDQLRDLGKQPLTAQSGNLTVITTAFAAGKTNTAVGAWGLNLEDALENAMVMTCAWLSMTNYEPEIRVFDEYDTFAENRDADLTALGTMRTNRDISYQNYIREMKRRNVLRPDFDEDENMKQLLAETPSEDTTMEDDGAIGQPKKPPAKKVAA